MKKLDIDIVITSGACSDCHFNSLTSYDRDFSIMYGPLIFECAAIDSFKKLGLWPKDFYCARGSMGCIFKKKEHWETCTRENTKVGDTVTYNRDETANQEKKYRVEYITPDHITFRSGADVVLNDGNKLTHTFLENIKIKKNE